MLLYDVSSTNNVFLVWVQGEVEKKMSRFLWKIGLSGLFIKKCEFQMQNS